MQEFLSSCVTSILCCKKIKKILILLYGKKLVTIILISLTVIPVTLVLRSIISDFVQTSVHSFRKQYLLRCRVKLNRKYHQQENAGFIEEVKNLEITDNHCKLSLIYGHKTPYIVRKQTSKEIISFGRYQIFTNYCTHFMEKCDYIWIHSFLIIGNNL